MSLAFTKATIAEDNGGGFCEYFVFSVYTPSEPKVGEELSVEFDFVVYIPIHIDWLGVELYGAGIDYSETLVEDENVDGMTVKFYTVLVTPEYEDTIYCEIYAEYAHAYTGAHHDWGVYLDLGYARNTTYTELLDHYYDLSDDYYDLLVDYDALNSTYQSLLADYNDLNSTYYDLLDSYNELQSDYNNLQESYTTLNTNYNTLQTTYNSLLTNYTNLQGDYDSLSSNYDTLETDYNSLESSYNSLQTSYNSLNSTYNDLKSKHDTLTGGLGTTRNLNYLFIITTIVFIATTVFFAIRKPKVKPESKAT